MYEFIATYENMHTEEKRTSTIAFYGYGFFKTEKRVLRICNAASI